MLLSFRHFFSRFSFCEYLFLLSKERVITGIGLHFFYKDAQKNSEKKISLQTEIIKVHFTQCNLQKINSRTSFSGMVCTVVK